MYYFCVQWTQWWSYFRVQPLQYRVKSAIYGVSANPDYVQLIVNKHILRKIGGGVQKSASKKWNLPPKNGFLQICLFMENWGRSVWDIQFNGPRFKCLGPRFFSAMGSMDPTFWRAGANPACYHDADDPHLFITSVGEKISTVGEELICLPPLM
jgi:hypothetical protein